MTSGSPNSRRALRIAVQIVGFLAGIAALGWCVHTALKPENREQFAKLSTAPTKLIILMLLLSLVSLILNGLAFWIALLPVKRLKVVDVLATNGVCSFLAYLPFKLSAIMRFVIHNRRDKVPVATISAWFATLAVVMAVVFTVMIATVLHYGKIDAIWLVLTLGGLGVSGLILLLIARRFRGEIGLQRMERLVGFTRIPALKKPLRWKLWLQLHAGFDMIASPGALYGAMLNRLLDAGVQAARFVIAAKIFQVDLTLEQSILVSMLYFIVGVASPSGLVGLREGGAAVLAGQLLQKAGLSSDQGRSMFSAVALLVSASEAIAYLTGGAIGLAWLRPDRLLKLRASTPVEPGETSHPT